MSSVAALVTASGNTTTTDEALAATAIEASRFIQCYTASEGLGSWYYNSKGEGPYGCTLQHDGQREWSMFNAYRSGGAQGVHWKYTDDVNDSECLKDWKYYSSDGQTLLAPISGRTTTQNDPRRWCALPVYRPGGVQGKQWGQCVCRPRPTPKPPVRGKYCTSHGSPRGTHSQ